MANIHSTGARASVKIGNNFIPTITSFNITPCANEPTAIVASNSKVGTIRAGGTKAWSGDMTFASAGLSVFPGKSYENVSFFSGNEVNALNEGIVRSGKIVVTSANATINFGNGEPIQWNCAFNGSEALTETQLTSKAEIDPYIDNTQPVIVSGQSATCTVKKANGTTVETTNWHLTQIDIALSAAVSGGVATMDSNGWLVYCTGAVDFTFSMVFSNSTTDDLDFDNGDELSVDILLSNGQHMEFKWIRIGEIGSISCDNSSAEPLSMTVNGAMQAYAQTAEASGENGGYGQIKIGNTIYWPSQDAYPAPGPVQ